MLFKVATELEFNDATAFAAFAVDFEKFLAKYNSSFAPDTPKRFPSAPIDPALRGAETVRSAATETLKIESAAAIKTDVTAPGFKDGPVSTAANEILESSDEPSADVPPPPVPNDADGSSEATKQRRTRRTKAEMEAARAEAQGKELPKTNGAGASGTTAPVGKTYSQDDLKTAFAKMTQALGAKAGEKTAEILLHFKIERLRDLPAEHITFAVEWLQRLVSQPNATAAIIADEIPY